jgi:hypothetical protein
MQELPLNIIEFIHHPDLLNDQLHSEVQLVCLKSLYGLPLSQTELEIYRNGTGRQEYDATEQRKATFIAGRRSGKTGKIASAVVCFEAFRHHGLPPGEEAYILLLAPTIAQAKLAYHYILKYLRGSPILSKRIVKTTKYEIRLDNGIVISCCACTYDRVRGRTIIMVVCDEFAFWPDGTNAANPAEEVIAALVPGMATVSNPKLIIISTPFGKSGLLWTQYQERSALSFPVWQVTTLEMNPTVSLSVLEEEKRENEEKYCREYLAQFTDSVNSWIVPEILDPCIVHGRRELPYVRGMSYVAALDPASRRNDFTLAIAHRRPDGVIVVDRLARWAGKRAPLAFEQVLGEIREILQDYDINSAIGDQYYCDAIKEHLLKLGIIYEISIFGPQTRAKLYTNFKHLLVQQKIELLDNGLLLRQLRSLREEKSNRGQIDVRPLGEEDDLAIAVALAVNELTHPTAASTIELGISDRSETPLNLDPDNCSYAAVCQNYPECTDERVCLGFKPDERLMRWAGIEIANRQDVRSPVSQRKNYT